MAVTARIALTNCHELDGNSVHFLFKGKQALEATLAYGDRESYRRAIEVEEPTLAPVAAVRTYGDVAVGEGVYRIGSQPRPGSIIVRSTAHRPVTRRNRTQFAARKGRRFLSILCFPYFHQCPLRVGS